jgi:hypothetical protein
MCVNPDRASLVQGHQTVNQPLLHSAEAISRLYGGI